MAEKKLEKTVENLRYDPIQQLRDLMENSDEIPSETIIDGEYKVRNGWWHGLICTLIDLSRENMLRDDLKPEVHEFITKFSDKGFTKRLKTSEDIFEANTLVNKILESQK